MATNPTKRIRAGWAGRVAIAAALLALAAALAGCGGSSSSSSGTTTAAPSHAMAGIAPPEWAANTDGWPAHNYDLSNTRATSNSDINATNVAKLKPAWRFKLPYVGQFGAYASNPIVLDGVVYIQDPDSDVYALNQQTGAVMWKHLYKSPTPSGGRTASHSATEALRRDGGLGLRPRCEDRQAVDAQADQQQERGIDMAPQLYDNKVSCRRSGRDQLLPPRRPGDRLSLNANTGRRSGSSTRSRRLQALRPSEVNSGGGLWYHRRSTAPDGLHGCRKPGALPGTPEFPNGSSHPGADLYTDSLVALDERQARSTGSSRSPRMTSRDYDFQVAPIVRSDDQRHDDRDRDRAGKSARSSRSARQRQAALDAQRRRAQVRQWPVPLKKPSDEPSSAASRHRWPRAETSSTSRS